MSDKLCNAAFYRNVAQVAQLLDAGANIDALDSKYGRTPLMWAAYSGTVDPVLLLLERGADLSVAGAQGRTALHCAFTQDVIRTLLEAGADPNRPDHNGCTPLLETIKRRDPSQVRLLLKFGADPIVPDKQGRSALFTALQYNSRLWGTQIRNKANRIVAMLLAAGALVGLVEAAMLGQVDDVRALLQAGIQDADIARQKNIALWEAARRGYTAIVSLLLDAGAGLEAPDERNNTPLALAVENGYGSTVRLLLERGANPDANAGAPLLQAIHRKSLSLVRTLLDRGAAANVVNLEGHSALQCAAKSGHVGIARKLLRSGADIHFRDMEDRTCLFHAIYGPYSSEKKYKMAALLLRYGGDAGVLDADQTSLVTEAIAGADPEVVRILHRAGAPVSLISAAFVGDIDAVRFLLASSVPVDVEVCSFSCEHHTALTAAVSGGQTELARILLDHGADIEHDIRGGAMDAPRITPLILAIQGGDLELIRMLLHRGADANVSWPGWSMSSAIEEAVRTDRDEMVKLLLEYGAHPAGFANRPLLAAAANGNLPIMRRLLGSGASVHETDTMGRTALHSAASSGSITALYLLLAHGARADVLDTSGQSALDLAKERKHTVAVTILEEAEVKSTSIP